MKTNFLCRNALPRGSSVFLKMMVTVTALLCIHLCAYAQPMQITPLDGADVTVPVELQWLVNSQSTDIEIYDCSAGVTATDINLSHYKLSPEGPITINALEISGVTYNASSNQLVMVSDKHSFGVGYLYVTDLSGNILQTITLTGFGDTEGIVHLGGTRYAVTEERLGQVVFFDLFNNTSSINYNNSDVVQLPNLDPGGWGENDGIEGISYNPVDNKIHVVKEKKDKAYYTFSVPQTFPQAPNNVVQADLVCDIDSDPFGFGDAAGLHHLSLNNFSTANLSSGIANHVLLLSEKSHAIVETDGSCTEYGRLCLPSDSNLQLEGVTMDNNGNIYVVSEVNDDDDNSLNSRLYIYTNPNFNSGNLKKLIHTNSAFANYEVPQDILQIGTEYCWRVKDSSDKCTWSPLRSFTPVELCSSTSIQACNDNDPCTINDQQKVSTFDGSICVPCAGTLDGGSCNATCTTTQACDDGNPCTTGDVETIGANGNVCVPCMGTSNPSSCDAACTTMQTCDDDNPLTINDMETLAADGTVCSTCTGMPVNACSNTSVQPCDDGNPCTLNDEQTISNLDGTICMPCMGTTNVSSCDAACTTTETCDDGNPLTINDMETLAADGTICSACTGTPVEPCSDTSVRSCDDGAPCTEGDMETVSNLDGSVCVPCMGTSNPSSCDVACATTQTCDDGNPLTINDMETLAADGTVCSTCTGTPVNACSDTSVRSCDDGAPCTEGDMETVSNLDGSVCVPCEGTPQDTDGDGVCDAEDACPNFDNDLIGTACDDGETCTIDDVYTADCECKGTLIDEDGNGVCDTDDCLSDISISTYDVNQTYYEVSNTITTVVDASVEVNNNQQFTLNAGRYVKLTPGFKAKTGSVMRAYIDGCEPSSQKTEQNTLASVKHYPNPFKDEVTLEFNLDFDAEAQIIVSDVNGRTMSQIPVENLYQGTQTIGLSTQSWIPGIYFYQVHIKAEHTGIISHANGTLVKM